MKIFGFDFNWSSKQNREEKTPKFLQQSQSSLDFINLNDFGNQIYTDNSMFDGYGIVRQYRRLSNVSEIDFAVDEIVNSFAASTSAKIIDLNLSEIDSLSENKLESIRDEWELLYNNINVSTNLLDWFRTWYVDGISFFYIVYDEEKHVVIDLIQLCPTKITKVSVNDKNYYLYKPSSKNNTFGIYNNEQNGYLLREDSVVELESGIFNSDGKPISYLHKAIKPYNLMQLMEDSSVVYKVSRAPERRVFNIEVGEMNKPQTEAYIQNFLRNQKKNLTFDRSSGQFSTTNDIMSINDDYVFAKREGIGTSVETLSGGNVADMFSGDEYFLKKLHRSLNIPVSRFEGEGTSIFGRPSEMSRDEIKFDLFITKLRSIFNTLFLDILEIQLVGNNILSSDEFYQLRSQITFEYSKVNYFADLKELEILKDKFEALNSVTGNITTQIFSKQWIYKNIMNLDDAEITEIEQQIKSELGEESIEVDNMSSDEFSSDETEDTSNFSEEPDFNKLNDEFNDESFGTLDNEEPSDFEIMKGISLYLMNNLGNEEFVQNSKLLYTIDNRDLRTINKYIQSLESQDKLPNDASTDRIVDFIHSLSKDS